MTGGSGFIGTNFVTAAERRGLKLLNIDINPPLIPAHRKYWQELNILDQEKLIKTFQTFQPDRVLHLAARADVKGKTLEDYRVNIEGTANILEAIKKTLSIKRVIITSTQFVNQYHGKPKDDLDFAPHTIYGESKVITEQLTRKAKLNCVWTIIRPTNIWGPWHRRYPNEFWKILSKGLYIHPRSVKTFRSYGYVGNIVFQIERILEAPAHKVSGKVYYVGDIPIDLLDWVNGFSVKLTGRRAIVVPRVLIRLLAILGDFLEATNIEFPITSSRYRSIITSNDAPIQQTFTDFGNPPFTLDEGIEETVMWLRETHPQIVRRSE